MSYTLCRTLSHRCSNFPLSRRGGRRTRRRKGDSEPSQARREAAVLRVDVVHQSALGALDEVTALGPVTVSHSGFYRLHTPATSAMTARASGPATEGRAHRLTGPELEHREPPVNCLQVPDSYSFLPPRERRKLPPSRACSNSAFAGVTRRNPRVCVPSSLRFVLQLHSLRR